MKINKIINKSKMILNKNSPNKFKILMKIHKKIIKIFKIIKITLKMMIKLKNKFNKIIMN